MPKNTITLPIKSIGKSKQKNNQKEILNNMTEYNSTLIAHCGARKITRNELMEIPVPPGTRTHQPLSHYGVVEALTESLSFRLLEVVRDEYAVSPDGMKMFGVMDLNSEFDGCRFSIGLRNSNDKSMRLALTAGVRIFVCDNMAFSGDFNPLFHKHTRNLELRDSITLAVDRIHRNFLPLQAQVNEMKALNLSDETVKLIIYEAFVDRKLRGIPRHLLNLVHQHYFEPKYEEFESRTLWSLSNAFTSAFKELNPLKHFELTARLGAYLTKVQEGQDLMLSPIESNNLSKDKIDLGDFDTDEYDTDLEEDDFRELAEYEEQEVIDEFDDDEIEGDQLARAIRKAA